MWSGSPCMCRTTSPRPTTRPPPRRCWCRSRGPARCSCRWPRCQRRPPKWRRRSKNRSAEAARLLKWWRPLSASTMPSSRPKRTNRCWHAMRICPAVTSSAPSSSAFSRSGTRRGQKAYQTGTTAFSPPPRSDDEVGDMTARKPGKPNLRPVRELTPTLQYRTIHGYRRAYRVAGSGPAILLIHGIGDNSTTWSSVQSTLAQRFTVIAPDLLGHGKSDKPRADYSVAAYANGMRELLSVIDIDHVTVVGHSLGGGVAMQFAYQFPQLVDRLILVGSGGVTKDVNVALRIASLPMGSEALAFLRLPLVLPAMQIVGRVAGAVFGSTGMGRDLPDVLRILADLPEPTASSAFARTLRAVVDWRGQVVTMLDRCYLTQSVPVQLIWGTRDSVIPVSHGRMAHAAMPGSQLEIFEGSGHFPFHDDPDRFVEVVARFIDSSDPAVYDQEFLRSLLRAGISEGAISGSVDTRVAVLDAMGADERSAT